MKTEIVWKLNRVPRRFACHIESTETCEYYTLGDFNGILVFIREEKTLKFIDSTEVNYNTVKTIAAIISLWLGCLPYKVKINGINLT